jgi:hypothetical protein
MHWLIEIGHTPRMAAMMGWQMLWALILGFGLSQRAAVAILAQAARVCCGT